MLCRSGLDVVNGRTTPWTHPRCVGPSNVGIYAARLRNGPLPRHSRANKEPWLDRIQPKGCNAASTPYHPIMLDSGLPRENCSPTLATVLATSIYLPSHRPMPCFRPYSIKRPARTAPIIPAEPARRPAAASGSSVSLLCDLVFVTVTVTSSPVSSAVVDASVSVSVSSADSAVTDMPSQMSLKLSQKVANVEASGGFAMLGGWSCKMQVKGDVIRRTVPLGVSGAALGPGPACRCVLVELVRPGQGALSLAA